MNSSATKPGMPRTQLPSLIHFRLCLPIYIIICLISLLICLPHRTTLKSANVSPTNAYSANSSKNLARNKPIYLSLHEVIIHLINPLIQPAILSVIQVLILFNLTHLASSHECPHPPPRVIYSMARTIAPRPTSRKQEAILSPYGLCAAKIVYNVRV